MTNVNCVYIYVNAVHANMEAIYIVSITVTHQALVMLGTVPQELLLLWQASPGLCTSSPLSWNASCLTQLHLLQSNVTHHNQLFSHILQFTQKYSHKGCMKLPKNLKYTTHTLLYHITHNATP